MAKPSYLSIVQQVKAGLLAQGFNVDESECARFEVTRRAASLIAQIEPHVGLLSKPTGNNCDGYAVDILCWDDGIIVDILGAGVEGPNTPLWLENPNPVDPMRWRPALAARPAPLPSPPAPVPPPPGDVVAAVVNRLDRHEELLQLLVGGNTHLAEKIDELSALLNRRYVGKAWGITIVLSPEGPRS